MSHLDQDAARRIVNRLTAPIHPVDALKLVGVQMTPEAEAEARAVCDAPAELWAPPGLQAHVWRDDASPGHRCELCALRDDRIRCMATPCQSLERSYASHPSNKNVYFTREGDGS